MRKKKPNVFAKFTAAVHRGVDLRDKRDAALKVAARRSPRLRPTQAEINAAEVEYEAKVDVLVELDTTMGVACDDIVTECYTAVLADANSEDMAKA
jgi:ABC-type nitrate/sulfonate/bicarbonate transport system substrate-binding protein